VHSVVLLASREQAEQYTTGDIRLGFCPSCGFITNVAFDPTLHDYATDYEATQSYSPTFNAFARRLAHRLIDEYRLNGKDIIEIGCGQGEFLILLAEEGQNRGIGFDPAYRNEPLTSEARDRLTFIADFYSEQYTEYNSDFIVCKMTLEHIEQTADFVETVRRSVGNRPDTIVFFQIPNAEYVMRDVAFWDVYYEHCSYFSVASLFEVLSVRTEYSDQYLTIEARPGDHATQSITPDADDLARIRTYTEHFAGHVNESIMNWRQRLQDLHDANQRVVIWGSGSKGVAFLTTLGVTNEIQYCVDINPKKHGMFMAGTGHEIVAPEFLQAFQPDVVIVMNPVYVEEIRASLENMAVDAELIAMD